jgi:hypothetical protein
MLTIRRKQMEAFERYALDRFVERMLRYLAVAFPAELGTDDARARALVHRGIELSKGWGIEGEREVRRLVELLVVSGDRLPGAADGLRASLEGGLSGQAKIGLLELALLGRVNDDG